MAQYTDLPSDTYAGPFPVTEKSLFWNEGPEPVRIYTTLSGGASPNDGVVDGGRDLPPDAQTGSGPSTEKGVKLFAINDQRGASIPVGAGKDVYIKRETKGQAVVQSMVIG